MGDELNNDELRFRMVGDRPVPALDAAPDTVGLDEAAKRSGMSRSTLIALHAVIAGLAGNGLTDAAATNAVLWGWATDPLKVSVRWNRLGELKTDADLATFLAECHAKRLNPWKGEAYPIIRYDAQAKRMRIHVGVTINTMRCIAHATNAYVGLNAPVHEHTDGPQPDCCTLAAYKMIDGQRHKFAVTVYWVDYYPGPGTDSLWDKMPHVCLDTVCEAALLRRMFPEQLDRLFTAQEFARRDPEPTGPRNPDSQLCEEHDEARVRPTPIGPTNLAELHQALADLGVKSLPDRDRLIRDARRRHEGLEQANPRRFYTQVLKAAGLAS